jgi:hypothetical protein
MNEQPPKPRRGCGYYGCLTGVVLLVMLLGALLLGLHYVKKLVVRYTDTQPAELPTLQMSPAELAQAKERFESFQQAVREHHATKPLTLTADELNALIASGGDQQGLKGKVYVSLDGDQLKGELSVPLQDVGLSMFKSRYLNGSATFNLSFRDGRLSVTPQTIQVRGEPLPEIYLREIRKQNLAFAFTNDPGAAAVLKGLEEIQVKEGKLVIAPKEPQ